MHIDIGNRGGKKFRHLFLVEPNFAVFGVQSDRSFAVNSVIDDYVAFLIRA